MTHAAQISSFIPRDYDIFGGLDVDKKSMAVTFTDHGTMRKSLKLPHSASQLLNYTRKHFPGQRVAFVYEAGPTGFGLYDELTAASHPCLVVSPATVPIGDSRLRNKLIQCAWVAINQDPELRAFYRRIYERQPKKVAARKAIVAVARKLTTRMYAVLKEQRPFESVTNIVSCHV